MLPLYCVERGAWPSSCILFKFSMVNWHDQARIKEDIPSKLSRTSLAASTFAGLSRLGFSDDSNEMTLRSCGTATRSGEPITHATRDTYDWLYCVDWQPPFTRVFVAVLVLTRRVLTICKSMESFSIGQRANCLPEWKCRRLHRDRLRKVTPRWETASMQTLRQCLLFGCHIGVMNRILGGERGKSSGKLKRALKKPPSLIAHYIVRACILGTQATEHGYKHSLKGIWRSDVWSAHHWRERL